MVMKKRLEMGLRTKSGIALIDLLMLLSRIIKVVFKISLWFYFELMLKVSLVASNTFTQ